MSIRALLRRFREQPRGQSFVEFALILPVFLVIMSAAVDLGRMAYARVTIANVAREASFQAAQTPTAYLAGQPCAAGNEDANKVICRAILESKGSVVTVAPADITLTCNPNCEKEMGNTVTVTVTGHFNLLTPVMSVFFGGTSITFSSTATNQISALPPMPTAPPGAPTDTPVPSVTPEPSVTPVPTVMPCQLPSAAFTYTKSGSNSPVDVTVTDTSTASASCGITQWTWNWGDGSAATIDFGAAQLHTHRYLNPGPGNKNYHLTLTVQNSAGSNTSGAAIITVKP
jgi:Flp pilus assembly protein TadG